MSSLPQVLPICSKLEAEIQELPPEDRGHFLAEAGLAEPGLNVLIRASFELLGLQGDLELLLEPVARIPVQLSGTVKIAGQVTIRLQEATLR